MIAITGIGQHHDLETGQESNYARLQGPSGTTFDLPITGDVLTSLVEFIGQEHALLAQQTQAPRPRRSRPRMPVDLTPEADPSEAFGVGSGEFDDVPQWDGE